jgi:endonuclease/exonuclease/phosphatase family metal-dependent hydrolase
LRVSGELIDAVSYEGDTGAPYTEGSGSGLFDSSSDPYMSISRFPDGTDSDQNNIDLQTVCITPGRANTELSSGCTNAAPALEIFQIQGSGAVSPFDGQAIRTSDNVVTAVGPEGFFMQTPAIRGDGDGDTSDGIHVFTLVAPTVAIGDQVDVTGEVVEYFDFTEFTAGSSVTVTGIEALPAAVVFDAATPSPDPTAPSCAIEYECYEGMLVEIVDGTVTGPNQRFRPDPIAEIFVTAAPARTFREPGIEFPGMPGYPLWDGNPEVFELDPNKMGLANEMIPAGSSFSAVGGLGFEFGGYELWPSQLDFTPVALPVAVRSREIGEMTVGSLNLLRLFDDVDDGGEFVPSPAEYQRRLTKFAAYIIAVLDAPDVLAVQEVEKLGVLEALAAEIALMDPVMVYSAELVEGNDVGGIDVGFLVRDTVVVDAVTQLAAGEILTYDGSLLHDRPPLLLEGRCIAGGLPGQPVRVVSVHMRSLSGIDTERVRQKRLEQAESVANIVQGLQTDDPATPLVVTGDFNAFEFSDSYVDIVGHIRGDFVAADNLVCESNACTDLVDPDLTNQVLSLTPEERYSFIFRGNAQTLDHALTTEATDVIVRGYEYGRGNADAAVDLINDETTALRSSDHDGLVLYLIKDSDQDGVTDDLDVCADTVIPESVPTEYLGINHFALVDGDGQFDTTLPSGGGPRGRVVGPGYSFSISDTAGCSCEQIIAAADLGQGHVKFGCPLGEMLEWVELVNP